MVRIWEFEIVASYEGLGQVLTYLALARKELNFARSVRGVLAAFKIQHEIQAAIEVLNLGVELVFVHDKLRAASGVPWIAALPPVLQIPRLATLLPPTSKES